MSLSCKQLYNIFACLIGHSVCCTFNLCVCMFQKGLTSKFCFASWKYWNGNCYYVPPYGVLNKSEAEFMCSRFQGAQLIKLNNTEEQVSHMSVRLLIVNEEVLLRFLLVFKFVLFCIPLCLKCWNNINLSLLDPFYLLKRNTNQCVYVFYGSHANMILVLSLIYLCANISFHFFFT